MNLQDIATRLANGQRPIVEFQQGIHDKESYAEPNMRARIIGCSGPDRDKVARIMFDFAEFDSHNRAFESSNYYDKAGKPVLTAREAAFYHPQDHMYFDDDENLSRHMKFVDDAQQALFDRYKQSGAEGSYVAWLEAQVLATAQP